MKTKSTSVASTHSCILFELGKSGAVLRRGLGWRNLEHETGPFRRMWTFLEGRFGEREVGGDYL